MQGLNDVLGTSKVVSLLFSTPPPQIFHNLWCFQVS